MQLGKRVNLLYNYNKYVQYRKTIIIMKNRIKKMIRKFGELQAPEFSYEEYLTNNLFSFGRFGGPTYSSAVRFFANGDVKFDNIYSENERFWRIDGSNLVLETSSHQPSTVFDLKNLQREKRLIGEFLLDASGITHQLSKVGIAEILESTATQIRASERSIEQLQNYMMDKNLENLKAGVLSARHKKARMAFILNAPETLDAVLPLIKAAVKNDFFEVRVVPVRRFFRGTERQESLQILLDLLCEKKIEVVLPSENDQTTFNRLKNWRPDYVLRQTEWDQDFPEPFAIKNFFWTKMLYVPYVVLEDFILNPNSDMPLYTMEFFENVWRIFLPSPLNKANQLSLRKTFISEEIFSVVGSMKAQAIARISPKWPVGTNAKKVLWMPHHSVGTGWFNMGTFDSNYSEMLAWATNHPEVSVALNAHPSLRDVIAGGESSIMTIEMYDSFVRDWLDLPNTSVITGESNYPYSAMADVVITDGISSLYEVQLQVTPIVYIEREDHVPFTEEGESWMSGVHRVPTMADALQQTSEILDTGDEFQNAQYSNINRILEPADVAQIIMGELYNDFYGE